MPEKMSNKELITIQFLTKLEILDLFCIKFLVSVFLDSDPPATIQNLQLLNLKTYFQTENPTVIYLPPDQSKH